APAPPARLRRPAVRHDRETYGRAPVWSRWPPARRPTHAASSLPFREDRPSDTGRKDVVQEEVQLGLDADAMAAAVVDWNDRFHSDLNEAAGPDHTGIHRSGHASIVDAVERLLHGDLHQGNHPVEGRGQAHVLDKRLEVRKAVLDRKAQLKDIGMLFDAGDCNAGVRVD